MLGRVKSVLRMMGQGLACQDLGELSPTTDKIEQIEQHSRNYCLSGGQARNVLIAGMHALGPAFEFSVELARSTQSLIEVLYVDCRKTEPRPDRELINQLSDLGCDFHMTYLKGNLLERLADYHAQRRDIMAIVSSAAEDFAQQLHATSESPEQIFNLRLPNVLLIDGHLLA